MSIATIREHRRRHGVRRTAAQLTHRLANRCTTCIGLEAMTLTEGSIDPSYLEADDALTFRFLTSSELRRFADDSANEMTHPFLDDVLGKGDRCFGCLDGDQLASYGWYGTDTAAYTDDLMIEFAPGWMYMSKGFTRPEFRGRRLHAVGMGKAMQAAVAEGAEGLISVVETTNYASLRSCARLGYDIFGRARAVRIGGRYLVRNSASCQRHAFRLRERTASDPAVPSIG